MLLLGWLFEKPKFVLSSVDVACLIATLFLLSVWRGVGEILIHILSLSIDGGAFMQIRLLVKLLTSFNLENRTSGFRASILCTWKCVVASCAEGQDYILVRPRMVAWCKTMQRKAFLCQKKNASIWGLDWNLPAYSSLPLLGPVHFQRSWLEFPLSSPHPHHPFLLKSSQAACAPGAFCVLLLSGVSLGTYFST